MNVCAKFRYAPLHIKKALGIFREVITTTTTTRVADPKMKVIESSDLSKMFLVSHATNDKILRLNGRGHVHIMLTVKY